MTRFEFPLKRVLSLRTTQLEVEEARLQQQAAAIAELSRQRAAAQSAGIQAEAEVRNSDRVTGSDLAALGAFRSGMRQQDLSIAARLVQCKNELAAQRATMLEARRRVRLLERLQERRKAEWQAAADKEIAEVASESYLARWSRER